MRARNVERLQCPQLYATPHGGNPLPAGRSCIAGVTPAPSNAVEHRFSRNLYSSRGRKGPPPHRAATCGPLRSHATRAPPGQALGSRQLSLAPAPSEPFAAAPARRKPPPRRLLGAGRLWRGQPQPAAGCAKTSSGAAYGINLHISTDRACLDSWRRSAEAQAHAWRDGRVTMALFASVLLPRSSPQPQPRTRNRSIAPRRLSR